VSESQLRLTVVPGAARNSLSRREDGSIRVRVAAPAREGKANRELLRYLASVLGVPRSAVSLRHGETSRYKVVSVSDLDPIEAERRLESEAGG
jgi:uncharacterized protein (TIGR00251 family)